MGDPFLSHIDTDGISKQLDNGFGNAKLAYSYSTAKRLAHLVALFRLTREKPGELFHPHSSD